jgi:hypothetical protein
MDDHNRLGFSRDFRGDLPGIHVPGDRIAIDENGRRAGADDRCRAGDDRERRQDDFVAGPDPQCRDGDVEGAAAVADGDAVLAADEFGEFRFKSFDERPFG